MSRACILLECDSSLSLPRTDCQRWDWQNTGHKALCKGPVENRKIHIILRELFVAEHEWLKEMSPEEKETYFRDDFQDEPLNHQFLSGEVAMVLARANTAALMINTAIHRLPYGSAYYSNVIQPWYERNQEFLNEQGFVVDYISHDVFLSNSFCQCVVDGVPCGKLAIKAPPGAALVKDVRNPHVDLVDKVFGKERDGVLENWPEGEIVTWEDMMTCVSFTPTDGDAETGSDVCYLFLHPQQVYGDVEVCCSSCYSLLC